MSQLPIGHYGLHIADDSIAYLHQGKSSASNFLGLKRMSPFQSRPEGAKACPHLINPFGPAPDRVHLDEFCKLYPDNLFQQMLPVPKERFARIPYFNDPNNDLSMTFMILGKLCSPLVNIVQPYRALTERSILDKLALTNLAPLVLTGITTEDQASINKLVKEAQLRPRRLILAGDPMLVVREPMVRMTTIMWEVDNHELVQLPMEQLGAMALRRHVRNERIDTPYTRSE